MSASQLYLKKSLDCASRSLSLVPRIENELASFTSLLNTYFKWTNFKEPVEPLLKSLYLISPMASASPDNNMNCVQVSDSFLLLKFKAEILSFHPSLISNSIPVAISCLQSALRLCPSHLQTWIILANLFFVNLQYSAAFKGFAKVLLLYSTNENNSAVAINLGNLLLKMTESLFKSNSYELCLLFIDSLQFVDLYFDLSFIEETNPFEVPELITFEDIETNSKAIKLIFFQSALALAKEFFESGETFPLIKVLVILYNLVSHVLENDSYDLLDELITFTIYVFNSRAIELLEKNHPDQIIALHYAAVGNLFDSPDSLFRNSLYLDFISKSHLNYELLSCIIKEINKECHNIFVSDICINFLYLAKFYLSLKLFEDDLIKSWLNLAVSLILLDVNNLVDSTHISPCIFAILRGLCSISIEEKRYDLSSTIWLITGKWLLTKHELSIAQHSFLVAFELSYSTVNFFLILGTNSRNSFCPFIDFIFHERF